MGSRPHVAATGKSIQRDERIDDAGRAMEYEGWQCGIG